MGLAGSASALTGKQPLVIILCKFTDQTDEPRDRQHFRDLFSETGAGESNVFDFWKIASAARWRCSAVACSSAAIA
jgi:hypothetical protein